jgi:hydrogenase expression/formation protein HypC
MGGEQAWSCHMCLAIPARIVELVPDSDRMAVVDVVGVRRRVSLGLLEEGSADPGDWVLIHVGFAMSRISEADAHEQMRMLEALGEAAAAMEEVRGYDSDDAEPPGALADRRPS